MITDFWGILETCQFVRREVGKGYLFMWDKVETGPMIPLRCLTHSACLVTFPVHEELLAIVPFVYFLIIHLLYLNQQT